MRKYYLAYGSNLNIEQMKHRCPTAKKVGVAYINNYRLAFKGHPTCSYYTIIPAKGHRVPVGVWEVDEDCKRSLDVYEGYPRFYTIHTFRNIELIRNDGTVQLISAFAYIMNKYVDYGMPTGNYYITCSQGYKDFNFDIKYIDDSMAFTKKMMKRNKR